MVRVGHLYGSLPQAPASIPQAGTVRRDIVLLFGEDVGVILSYRVVELRVLLVEWTDFVISFRWLVKLFPKLALLLSVTAVIPLAALALFGLNRTTEALRRQLASEQERQAGLAAVQVSEKIRAILHSLDLYAGYADFGERRHEVLVGVLRVAFRQSEDISIISLVDERGEALVPSVYLRNPERTKELRDHPAVNEGALELHASKIPLKASLATGAAIGPPYGERGEARVALAVNTGHRREGRRLVLVAEVDLKRIIKGLKGSNFGEVSLLDPEGGIIGDSSDVIPPSLIEDDGLPTGVQSGSFDHLGEPNLWVFSPVPLIGWGVVVSQPEHTALAAITQLRRRSLYWAFVCVVIAVFFAALVARDLSGRIGEVARSAQDLSRGDLNRRAKVMGHDELAGLAQSFNKMAHEIQVKRDQIEEKNRLIQEWNENLERKIQEKTEELARAQEVVLRARRLAGLGVLGAGVAHEINNPLTSTLGYLQLILLDKNLNETHKSSIDQALISAARIREIVQNLLKLADGQRGPPWGDVVLVTIVHRAVQFVQAVLDERCVKLIIDVSEQLPAVAGNTEQLTELVLHLLRNALNAMSSGGTLHISARQTGGQFITLRVEDTGKGIPPELIDRIFDPFFTTKDDWEGRGLGLSIAHKIVDDHGGRLDISSEVGRGTLVTITLAVAAGGRHLT
jgi:signal transduction histidine kinase